MFEEEDKMEMCSHDDCEVEMNTYCPKHKVTTCHIHWCLYHMDCCKANIKSSKELADLISIAKKMLDTLHKCGQTYPTIKKLIEGYDGEIEIFKAEYNDFQQDANVAVYKKDSVQLFVLYPRVLDFIRKLKESRFYEEYSEFMLGKNLEREMGLDPHYEASPHKVKELTSEIERKEEYLSNLTEKHRRVWEQIEELRVELNSSKGHSEEMAREMKKMEVKIREIGAENKDLKERAKEVETKLDQEKEKSSKKDEEMKSHFEEQKKEKADIETQLNVVKDIASISSHKLDNGSVECRLNLRGDSSFIMGMHSNIDRKYIEGLINLEVKIPDLWQIRLDTCKSNDELMVNFFNSCLPNSLDSLALNFYHNSLVDMNDYSDCIKQILPQIKCELLLSSFKISKEVLEDLVNSIKCSKIIFWRCDIDSSSPLNFLSTSLTHLSFQSSGTERRGDWGRNEDKWRNIIRAVADSPMKDNLEKLSVEDCELDLERMRKISEEEGFDPDRVVEEPWIPARM